jgi:FecR protein
MQISGELNRALRKRAVQLKNLFSPGRPPVVFALLACILSGCDYIPPKRVLAQVLQTSGEAFAVADSAHVPSTRTSLTLNSTIRPGQIVETAPGATAMISLLPGMVLLLNPETVLRIDDLLLITSRYSTTYYIRSREAHVRLLRGSIYATTPGTVESAELQIATPAGALIAPRTACFYIRAGADTVRVTTSKGQLTFQSNSGGAAQTLDQGYYGNWSPVTGALSEPRAVEADEEAFQQSKEARDLERRVLDLIEKRQNVLPGFRTP